MISLTEGKFGENWPAKMVRIIKYRLEWPPSSCIGESLVNRRLLVGILGGLHSLN